MTLGRKIRELRQVKDWSLAKLCERSGVALSSLSRIETGKMTGTLESHVAVAKALGVRLTELYASLEPAGPAVEVHRPQPSENQYVTAKGATFTLLTSSPTQKKMLPALMTLAPKKSSQGEKGPAGSEKLLYLLKGNLEVSVGSEKFQIKQGEAIYFQAFLPHNFSNSGAIPAVALSVTSPSTL